jgi:hypothetical protein
MSYPVAFGTLPPTPAAAPGHQQECVTGVEPLSPPLGASVIALTPRAAADPFGAAFRAAQPNLGDSDIGILRGLFLKPGAVR